MPESEVSLGMEVEEQGFCALNLEKLCLKTPDRDSHMDRIVSSVFVNYSGEHNLYDPQTSGI